VSSIILVKKRKEKKSVVPASVQFIFNIYSVSIIMGWKLGILRKSSNEDKFF